MAFLLSFAIMAGFILFFVIIVVIFDYCSNMTGYNIQVQQTTDNVITDN